MEGPIFLFVRGLGAARAAGQARAAHSPEFLDTHVGEFVGQKRVLKAQQCIVPDVLPPSTLELWPDSKAAWGAVGIPPRALANRPGRL